MSSVDVIEAKPDLTLTFWNLNAYENNTKMFLFTFSLYFYMKISIIYFKDWFPKAVNAVDGALGDLVQTLQVPLSPFPY